MALTALYKTGSNTDFANGFSIFTFVLKYLKPFLVLSVADDLGHFDLGHTDELYVIGIQLASEFHFDVNFFI